MLRCDNVVYEPSMSTQPCTTAVSAGNDVIVIWFPGAPSLSSLISEPVDP